MTLSVGWSIRSRVGYPVQVTFAQRDTGAQLPCTLLLFTRSIAFKAVTDAPQFVAQGREFLLQLLFGRHTDEPLASQQREFNSIEAVDLIWARVCYPF